MCALSSRPRRGASRNRSGAMQRNWRIVRHANWAGGLSSRCLHAEIRLATSNAIDGSAAVHWRSGSDRFASGGTGHWARPEDNASKCNAVCRIVNVLAVTTALAGPLLTIAPVKPNKALSASPAIVAHNRSRRIPVNASQQS